DPPLDFPDVVEVISKPDSIPGAESAPKARRALRHRVEEASVFLYSSLPCGSRSWRAKQPLEDHPWVDLGRQRHGGCAPGDVVHVGTAVERLARADEPAGVLDAELERGQGRGLTGRGGKHLIERRAVVDVGSLRHLRTNA